MEIDNLRVEDSDGEPIVRMNAEKREQLGTKLGDTVIIKRTVTETVKAKVHQAKSDAMDEVVLEGGNFEEEEDEQKLEVVTEEVEGNSTEETPEDERYEDE